MSGTTRVFQQKHFKSYILQSFKNTEILRVVEIMKNAIQVGLVYFC